MRATQKCENISCAFEPTNPPNSEEKSVYKLYYVYENPIFVF